MMKKLAALALALLMTLSLAGLRQPEGRPGRAAM